jgi:hypothetical protein
MTVYVDDMYLHEMGRYERQPRGRVYKMSHMIADTRDELVAMARTIGVNPRWIQKKGQPGEHFDICMSMREKAIAAGAVPISMRQCSTMCLRRRVEGQLGKPDEAEAWRAARPVVKLATPGLET